MPTILALFGSLLVVVFSAWLNTKALSAQIEGVDKKLTAQIEALRAEMRRGFAELRLDFHTEISQLTRRVERLEEQRGLVRP
jgi:predicted PurR-regulated permease PerM